MGKQHFLTFLEGVGLLRVHHVVDKGIDLLGLDALQVIAHADVELVAHRASQPVFLCHKSKQKPCLDIFVLSLGHVELRRPLTVVALILRQDTGLVDACRKLRSVHDLYGLQFEETASRIVGCRDILRQLAVWACRRADGRLQLPSEDGLCLSLICHIGAVYSKYGSFFVMLCPNPV